MRAAVLLLMLPVFSLAAYAQMRTVVLPGKSQVVTLRLVFTTGSAQDPADKPGVAHLTASMLSDGGSKDMTYAQLVDAFFPMAAGVGSQVDHEMTTFFGATHIDNLDAYYKLFHAMLLEPGWREEDFQRLKDNAINALKVGLRGNNDEELGKEVLLSEHYRGTPYGHYSGGALSALQKITLNDVKEFYKQHYTQSNLIIGLAGGYPPEFLERVRKSFSILPLKDSAQVVAIHPPAIEHTRATIVEKNTRSVAYSFGFPLDVRRGDPDYPALLVAQSYLGQHRAGGRLFERIREARGLNYGDYAYIEYFPGGGFRMEAPPNVARTSQAFQIWIRPVEPPQAPFALRLAFYELDKLVKDGIPENDFERTRNYLSQYVNVLTKTKRAELGYAIDSLYYGIPNYNSYIKNALVKLTREQVNEAIRKHLRVDRVQIVAVSPKGDELKRQLIGAGPSPIAYNSPKPPEILAEDKIAGAFDLGLRPEDVTIVPLEKIFE